MPASRLLGKRIAEEKAVKKIAVLLLLLLPIPLVVAQKKYKPWTTWSEKDAQKILDDSPWGQTQIDTDLSEMFYSPTSQSGGGGGAMGGRGGAAPSTSTTGSGTDEGRDTRGAYNRAVALNLRIRFLTALPIRQAFARTILLRQQSPSAGLEKQLMEFVERDFGDWIVVAVNYDSTDQRLSGPALQMFGSATSGTLKNATYLETKDGRRNFLADYQPPSNDGLGAKFFFARTVEGESFIRANSGDVRFYSEVGKKLKLNMRFKIADFMYDGALQF